MAGVATIVSSVATAEHPQIDGRFWVTELHTDSLGVPYTFSYLAAAGTSDVTVNATLAARAAGIVPLMAAQEVANNLASVSTLGSLATPTEKYSTTAQNLAALGTFWKLATPIQIIMIGDYFNSLSDVVLQTVLGINETQVTSLRTNFFAPYAAAATTVRGATAGAW